MSMIVTLQYNDRDEKLPQVHVYPIKSGRFASVEIGGRLTQFKVYVNYTDCQAFAARLEEAAAALRELGATTMHVVPRFRLIEEREF